jgi:hypothetical protein
MSVCSIDYCTSRVNSHGLCVTHDRQRRQGIPFRPVLRRRASGSLADRLWARVTRGTDEQCWEWNASGDQYGYGSFVFEGVRWKAHRAAWTVTRGPIPPGLVVDHKCHNPACVNPGHLQVVTQKQNNENLLGARSHSRSGVRGVSWSEKDQRWVARVVSNYRTVWTGYYRSLDEASREVVKARLRFHTNNLADRVQQHTD